MRCSRSLPIFRTNWLEDSLRWMDPWPAAHRPDFALGRRKSRSRPDIECLSSPGRGSPKFGPEGPPRIEGLALALGHALEFAPERAERTQLFRSTQAI